MLMANKIDMFDNPPDISMKMPISSPFSYAEVGLSNMSDEYDYEPGSGLFRDRVDRQSEGYASRRRAEPDALVERVEHIVAYRRLD